MLFLANLSFVSHSGLLQDEFKSYPDIQGLLLSHSYLVLSSTVQTPYESPNEVTCPCTSALMSDFFLRLWDIKVRPVLKMLL